jgi:hypothetical protein
MNTVAMLLSIAAAIRIPSWSYKLTGVVAVGAFIFALHQVQTNQGTWLTLLFPSLLNVIIVYRFVTHRRHLPKS